MSSQEPPSPLDPTCAGLFPVFTGQEERLALRDAESDAWLTADALRKKVMALARTIAAPRKRLVFLLATNTSASVIGLLAAVAAGHAAALIDPDLAADKLDHLLAAYQPDIILTSGAFGTFPPVAGHPDRWRIVDGDLLSPGAALCTNEPAESEIAPDLLLLLSTSGTTGSVKFVRLSAKAILANATQIATSLAIDRDSVAIAHLPLHYSYGLSVVTSHLITGARVAVIDDAITSPSFWEKVGLSGGTHFPGVPFHYMVLARLGFSLVPRSVTTFTQAGGPLDTRFLKSVLDKVMERHARFFVMYGQTEASPRITTLPSDRVANKTGSVGIALAGGRLTIAGDGGAILPAGETGSVIYEGPNVMMGYAKNRADLLLGDLLHGKLDTGDIGRLDDEGYLFLSGRTKRFAKIAGLRLGLDEIEAEVSEFGYVACLDAGDRILVLYEGDIADALKIRLKALSIGYKIPATSFAHRRVTMMPRKPSGKIDYARLKEMMTDV